MCQQISDNPLGYIPSQIFMEVAIVVNNIHLLMDCFNLIEDSFGSRFVHMVDHVLIYELQISSQNDIEIYGASEAIHVISTECVNYLRERSSDCNEIEQLVTADLSVCFRPIGEGLEIGMNPFLQI